MSVAPVEFVIADFLHHPLFYFCLFAAAAIEVDKLCAYFIGELAKVERHTDVLVSTILQLAIQESAEHDNGQPPFKCLHELCIVDVLFVIISMVES